MDKKTKQLIEMHAKTQKRLDELEAERSRLKAQWDWASGELVKRGYVLSASGQWMYAPRQTSLAKERTFNQSDEEFTRLMLVWKTLYLRSQSSPKAVTKPLS